MFEIASIIGWIVPLGLLAGPANAAEQRTPEVFAEHEAWQVLHTPARCQLVRESLNGEPRFEIAVIGDGPPSLEIVLAEPVDPALDNPQAGFRIGGLSDMLGIRRDRSALYLYVLSDEIIHAVRAGSEVEVLVEGDLVGTVPLSGSNRAYGLFEDCLATLPRGPFVPSAPPPIRTTPDLPLRAPNTQRPPNSPPAPISPGRWIVPDDFPIHATEPSTVVEIELTVLPTGRVRDCAIVSLTGSNRLAERTCELVVRRGRFDPATDETGKAIGSSYSTTVRWEFP